MIAPTVAAVLAVLSGGFAVAATRSSRRAHILRAAGVQASGVAPARRLQHALGASASRPVVLASLGGAVAFVASGPVLGVLAGGIALLLPRWLRRRGRRRSAERLEEQLGSAVSGIGAALRAGQSLSQAIRYAAAESRPPVADELRAVSDREDLGLAIDASLGRWAASASSADVRLVANALRLRIGSGLPGVLDEIGRSLRQRRSVVREVRSLTAQARLSGSILAVLPVGFFLFMSLTSRHDMATAFSTPAGVAAIVGGLVLQAGGYVWIRRLIRVEV